MECRHRTYELLRFAPPRTPRAPAQTVRLSFITKPLLRLEKEMGKAAFWDSREWLEKSWKIGMRASLQIHELLI